MRLANRIPVCACGCGCPTKVSACNDPKRGIFKGEHRLFLRGHYGRGERNANWNGGRTVRDGYIYLKRPDHPRSSKNGGYVAEHVLVAEKVLGKFLPEGGVVHHVDEIRDNNTNPNLVVCQDESYHQLLHARINALRRSGYPNWILCNYCKNYGAPETMRLYKCAYRYNKDKYYQRGHHVTCKPRGGSTK